MRDQKKIDVLRRENAKLFFPSWMGETPRTGSNWSRQESNHLLEGMKAGCTIVDMSTNQGRSCLAIHERLKHISIRYQQFVDNKGHEGVNEGQMTTTDFSWLWDPTMQSPAQKLRAAEALKRQKDFRDVEMASIREAADDLRRKQELELAEKPDEDDVKARIDHIDHKLYAVLDNISKDTKMTRVTVVTSAILLGLSAIAFVLTQI